MKYFYNEDIKSISACNGGGFVVELKQMNESTGKMCSEFHLMDTFGRIENKSYDKVIPKSYYVPEERNDDCFVLEKDGINYLINENLNEIACAFENVSSFSKKGYATISFEERNFWINREGILFGEEFENVYEFENGIAVAKLNNEKLVFVDEALKIISPEFDGAYSSGSKNYFIILENEKLYITDKNFQKLCEMPQGTIFISDYGYIYSFTTNNADKHFFDIYNVSGKHILSAKIVACSNDKMIRIIDNGTRYLNQETGKILGGEKGYFSGDFFNENYAVVGLGLDEKGEHIFGVIDEDGNMLGGIYESAFMAYKNQPAVFIPNAKATSGKFHLLYKDGQLSREGFSRLGTFHDDFASFECRKNKYTFINKNLKRFKQDYDKVDEFNHGYAIVKNANLYDIINKNATSLCKISRFIQTIDENINNVLNFPEELKSDILFISELKIYLNNFLNFKFSQASSNAEKEEINNKIKIINRELDKLLEENNQKSLA